MGSFGFPVIIVRLSQCLILPPSIVLLDIRSSPVSESKVFRLADRSIFPRQFDISILSLHCDIATHINSWK